MTGGVVEFRVNGAVRATCNGPANTNHDSVDEGFDIGISNCKVTISMKEGDIFTIASRDFVEWDSLSGDDNYSPSETPSESYTQISNKSLTLDSTDPANAADGKNTLRFNLVLDQQ